jgi:nitric oxide reductase NorQ protein
VRIGHQSRALRGHGLNEGASTRMLVHAGRLLVGGISLRDAVRASVVLPLTDDADLRDALDTAINALAA